MKTATKLFISVIVLALASPSMAWKLGKNGDYFEDLDKCLGTSLNAVCYPDRKIDWQTIAGMKKATSSARRVKDENSTIPKQGADYSCCIRPDGSVSRGSCAGIKNGTEAATKGKS